ncbi:MAG: serine/threonine protein phosphatase [Chlamydiae bacterium]|nr:MAG: serine/threonine protein phosphatase [Chlamydiota bacterium]
MLANKEQRIKNMFRNRGIAFKLTFFIIASSAIIFTLVFSYNYSKSRKIIIHGIEKNAVNLAVATANKIESYIIPIQKIPETIALVLDDTDINQYDITNLLKVIVSYNSNIYGATIAYEPYAFKYDSYYFAPYLCKNNNNESFSNLGTTNYNYFNWDWYKLPKKLGKPVWSEPYFDKGAGNVIMSTYSVPFYSTVDGKKVFKGVVTADVSLEWLQSFVSDIKISKSGYAFTISKSGKFITHPKLDFIMNSNVFDISIVQNNNQMLDIVKKMISGKTGFGQCDRIFDSDKKYWVSYSWMPSCQWSLGIFFPQIELMEVVEKLHHTVMLFGILGILFISLIIALIANSITHPLRQLSLTTKSISNGDFDVEIPVFKQKDEVGKLALAFAYMKASLKKYIKDLTEATIAKERMGSELAIGHEIQMGMVPKVIPPFTGRKEFDMFAALNPAKEVGGDLYDFFFIDEDNLCFFIGDVSGKGVPAALFMAVTKTLIKGIAMQSYDPSEILKRVNFEAVQNNDTCLFVTVFLAVLNIKTGEIKFANAGHNPPLIARGNKDVSFLKMENGCALGAIENPDVVTEKITLKHGDLIFLYTDGVTEAFNKNGELFSDEKLQDELASLVNLSAEKIVCEVLEIVRKFAEDTPQSDDITVLALRYKL